MDTVEYAKQQGISERHTYQLVHRPRGIERHQATQRNDEDALTRAIIALASQFGQYEYRRIAIKLKEVGWDASQDRRSGSGIAKDTVGEFYHA